MAVVLIIGLVGISVIWQSASSASGISESSSEIYWKEMRPVRVLEAGLAADSEIFFVVENSGPDPITINRIGIGEASASLREYGSDMPLTSIYLAPGEIKRVVASSFGSFDCMVGKKKDVALSIGYRTQYGDARVLKGEKSLAIRCNMNSGAYASSNQTSCASQGQGCGSGISCCEGLACIDNTCEYCRGEGKDCKDSSWCCEGLACMEGYCQYCRGEGGECADNSWCCEGLACMEGYCKFY
ncbi:MAG: hypothetical protein N3F07_00685 [Candidatus Micrarchaeota archaeon]|nr:hypothetical protein [Candidatus Micrarchaeota archaeon]